MPPQNLFEHFAPIPGLMHDHKTVVAFFKDLRIAGAINGSFMWARVVCRNNVNPALAIRSFFADEPAHVLFPDYRVAVQVDSENFLNPADILPSPKENSASKATRSQYAEPE